MPPQRHCIMAPQSEKAGCLSLKIGYFSLIISFVIVPSSLSLHCHRKHDHSSDILLQVRENGFSLRIDFGQIISFDFDFRVIHGQIQTTDIYMAKTVAQSSVLPVLTPFTNPPNWCKNSQKNQAAEPTGTVGQPWCNKIPKTFEFLVKLRQKMSFVPTFVDVTVTLLMAQIDYRYIIYFVNVRVRITK